MAGWKGSSAKALARIPAALLIGVRSGGTASAFRRGFSIQVYRVSAVPRRPAIAAPLHLYSLHPLHTSKVCKSPQYQSCTLIRPAELPRRCKLAGF